MRAAAQRATAARCPNYAFAVPKFAEILICVEATWRLLKVAMASHTHLFADGLIVRGNLLLCDGFNERYDATARRWREKILGKRAVP
jgi:hypothetical protein